MLLYSPLLSKKIYKIIVSQISNAGKENLLYGEPHINPPVYSSGPIPYFSGVRIARDSRALYNYTEEAINNLTTEDLHNVAKKYLTKGYILGIHNPEQ